MEAMEHPLESQATTERIGDVPIVVRELSIAVAARPVELTHYTQVTPRLVKERDRFSGARVGHLTDGLCGLARHIASLSRTPSRGQG